MLQWRDLRSKPVTVFYSYAHEDEAFLDRLLKHLEILKRYGIISGWHDREISAGDEWRGVIDAKLESADIVLLLVSADFLASDYCHDIEMKRALERHRAGEARVVPIILGECLWRATPVAELQVLPRNATPVIKFTNQDEAFNEIAEAIKAIAEGDVPPNGSPLSARGDRPPSLRLAVPPADDNLAIKELCNDLAMVLDEIDEETNWRDKDWVHIDVEVDVERGGKRRKVAELVQAIETHRDRRLVFIEGTPGSGKSVALRRLCRHWLGDARQHGQIPLYVNLRGWKVASKWSEENPPTEAQLETFVRDDVSSRLAGQSLAFFRHHFFTMLYAGRFHLVLDSFDEIPQVMDLDDSARVIDLLSRVMQKFLTGGTRRRGIVASRPRRKPNFSSRKDLVHLVIRPFQERQIWNAIDKAAKTAETAGAMKAALVSNERAHLIPAARTPFLLGLMLDHANSDGGELPETQAAIYEGFVGRRLARAKDRLAREAMTPTDVIRCASAMAAEMFGTGPEGADEGLEMAEQTLVERLPNEPVRRVVNVLSDGAVRLARRGEHGRTVSFVHRRFQEYFLAQHWKERPQEAPIAAIDTDSRYRDALVQFVEVADEETAKKIAADCVETISTTGPILRSSRASHEEDSKSVSRAALPSQGTSYRRLLNNLRFMAEAFRSRRAALGENEPVLADEIFLLVRQPNPLVAKHAVEAAGVLSDDSAGKVLTAALELGNPWVVDTAFQACRYLDKFPRQTIHFMKATILKIPANRFLSTYKDLKFSLSIVPSLRSVSRIAKLRLIELRCLLASLFIFLANFPYFITFFAPFSAFLYGVYVARNFVNKHFYEEYDQFKFFFKMLATVTWILFAFTILSAPLSNKIITKVYDNSIVKLLYPKYSPDAILSLVTLYYTFIKETYTETINYILFSETYILLYMIMIYIICTIFIIRIPYLTLLFFPYCISHMFFKLVYMIKEIFTEIKEFKNNLRVIKSTYTAKNQKYKYYLLVLYTIISLLVILSPLIILYTYRTELRKFALDNIQENIIEKAINSDFAKIALVLFVVMFIAWCISLLWIRKNDRNRYLYLINHQRSVTNRADISKNFCGFSSIAYRLRFLDWLEQQVENDQSLSRTLGSPHDPWPGGLPPYRGNDVASVRLAKLEEEWMKLDR